MSLLVGIVIAFLVGLALIALGAAILMATGRVKVPKKKRRVWAIWGIAGAIATGLTALAVSLGNWRSRRL